MRALLLWQRSAWNVGSLSLYDGDLITTMPNAKDEIVFIPSRVRSCRVTLVRSMLMDTHTHTYTHEPKSKRGGGARLKINWSHFYARSLGQIKPTIKLKPNPKENGRKFSPAFFERNFRTKQRALDGFSEGSIFPSSFFFLHLRLLPVVGDALEKMQSKKIYLCPSPERTQKKSCTAGGFVEMNGQKIKLIILYFKIGFGRQRCYGNV